MRTARPSIAPCRLAASLACAVGLTGIGPAAAQPLSLRDDLGRQVELRQVPQRVVSLSPALTEAVCLLGACDRLVGVDRYSNWPTSVAALPRLGGLDDTPLERVLRLRPDLVLAASSTRAVQRLAALGLPVLALEPKRLADMERMFDTVARAIGRPQAAVPAWQQMNARLDAAAARVPPALRGQRVYFEVATTPFAAGEASFVGELLSRLGLRNIVPAAMGPFPQLNPEFVLRAEPDLVMADGQAYAGMAARPGWSRLVALQRRRGCGFAPAAYDTLVRAGPRLADGGDAIAACLAGLDRRRADNPGVSR